VVNDLDALVRGAAIGGRSAADGRVPARRADPPARLDRRALRGWRNRVSAVGRRGKRELAMAPPWTGRDPRAVVPILRLGTGAQHLRRRFLRAAHWIILAVIVITGVAQSALARVLDPWIVTTRRAAIARADRSCLLAGVERIAGRSCRQACAAF
jgi:hypothetical protein